MKVIFGKLFSKDLIKIKDSTLKDDIIQVIIMLENVESIQKIPNIKKMKGHSEAYRIRIGKYRLGFFFEEEVIELARFARREDIYKLFP
ncbi:type II toxin-antitoxin system RelE/ParE family toxin [Flavobacterium sp.]|uniref:type II toxin-antitoxin system RelE family toxin n=1 Tax=Flavobacterium sp. TaxID=239 RepID=UPI00374CC41D